MGQAEVSIRDQAIAWIKKLGYNQRDIVTEMHLKAGAVVMRADIAVVLPYCNKEQPNVYVIVECKRDDARSESAIQQLQSYLAVCVNARWGVYFNGNGQPQVFKKVIDIEGQITTVDATELPNSSVGIDPLLPTVATQEGKERAVVYKRQRAGYENIRNATEVEIQKAYALTPNEAEAVRLRLDGLSLNAIARKMECTHVYVHNVLYRPEVQKAIQDGAKATLREMRETTQLYAPKLLDKLFAIGTGKLKANSGQVEAIKYGLQLSGLEPAQGGSPMEEAQIEMKRQLAKLDVSMLEEVVLTIRMRQPKPTVIDAVPTDEDK